MVVGAVEVLCDDRVIIDGAEGEEKLITTQQAWPYLLHIMRTLFFVTLAAWFFASQLDDFLTPTYKSAASCYCIILVCCVLVFVLVVAAPTIWFI